MSLYYLFCQGKSDCIRGWDILPLIFSICSIQRSKSRTLIAKAYCYEYITHHVYVKKVLIKRPFVYGADYEEVGGYVYIGQDLEYHKQIKGFENDFHHEKCRKQRTFFYCLGSTT